MPKLIRDGIPEDMRSRGYSPKISIVTGESRLNWLLEKLVEEATEARDDHGSLSELGDLYSVLEAIISHQGHLMYDVKRQAEEKAAKFGGFEKGYLWLNPEDTSAEALSARASYHQREGKE